MPDIKIKPLSVNEAWRGRRFKTEKYKEFEHDFFFQLPRLNIGPGPYRFTAVFGFSSSGADIDNPLKTTLDVLQKRYKFNDSAIYEMAIFKEVVPKGQEFISFEIETIK